MNFRVRLKISIVLTIVFIITVLSSAMLISLWHISSNTAESVAKDLFDTTSRRVSDKTQGLIDNSFKIASFGAVLADKAKIEGNGLNYSALPFLFTALKNDKSLYSLYYGFKDGSFLQVIPAKNNEKTLKAHSAPKDTFWIIRTITQQANTLAESARIQTWSFLDVNQQVLNQKLDLKPKYDPRERLWYKAPKGLKAPMLSSPYVFDSLNQPGITVSIELPDSSGVFGVDIVLDDLQNFISKQHISDNGGIVLFDENEKILASSSSLGSYSPLISMKTINRPQLKAIIANHQEHRIINFLKIDHEQSKYLLSLTETKSTGARIFTAIIAPSDDFDQEIRAMQLQILYLYLAGLLIFTPLALIFSTYLSRSLDKLTHDAERIRKMDFAQSLPIKSHILEFHNLGAAFHQMKSALSRNKSALEVSQEKLNRLVELGIAMSSEHDSAKLMEMVLLGAKELANADGGTLYTVSKDNKLQFQILRTNSLGIKLGGSTGNKINIPSVPLFDKDGKPNHKNIVSHTVHEEKTVNISDAYHNSDFDFSGTIEFDKANHYHSKSFLTVPLKPRGGNVIGALQIIKPLNSKTGEIEAFSPEIQRFIEALAAQAATALYNRDLISAQEELLDSMIKLIAGAIDIKSPYTGGHCERVPELAVLLAKKACLVDTGNLADFNFVNEDEWREFEIGAWLHDCGKVVTPEYVVDKATKLETIYNRIHEIRARFEILLRDAEISNLKAIMGGADSSEMQQVFEARKESLIADFSFIADCNLGGEFLDDSKIEKLKELGETSWVRNFDDRLGLAQDELDHFDGDSITPNVEKLLDDKPNHVIPRQLEKNNHYDGYDFKIDVPTNLYNKGELYNLTISRGTLTAEERYKINEHVMQTIVMLESLPFPKHLQRIPEYAGTHHETLIGTGYPRKLDKDDLTIPARIMAIADVFEALTAPDRPYKKIKTLSESIHILSFFKNNGHIDGDLFDLFLTSGTYKTYADKFLLPEQIDEVDITKYID